MVLENRTLFLFQNLKNLLILKPLSQKILNRLRFLLILCLPLQFRMILLKKLRQSTIIILIINLIKTTVDQFFRNPLKLQMIPDLIASPGFHIKLPSNITAGKAFLIQIILPHQIKKNLLLSLWNQQIIPHLPLHLLMTTILINTIIHQLLLNFKKSIRFMLHTVKLSIIPQSPTN